MEFVLLNKKDALKLERQPRKSGGPRLVYHFKCANCNNIVKIRSSELKTKTGKCQSCGHKKRPYESIYNGLLKDHRGIKVELTYEEFLEFTKIKKCEYCPSIINWNEYGTVNGEFISRSYFLDRKFNNGPYSKENCVVCCTRCNIFKGSMNHNEFIGLCNLISSTFLDKVKKLCGS